MTITNSTVTREHVWATFRHTSDVRWRERDHAILLLMDGKSCPEVAQWLYRDEETIRAWVQTASQHYLPPWGMKPTVSDRRNLVNFHPLTRAH